MSNVKSMDVYVSTARLYVYIDCYICAQILKYVDLHANRCIYMFPKPDIRTCMYVVHIYMRSRYFEWCRESWLIWLPLRICIPSHVQTHMYRHMRIHIFGARCVTQRKRARRHLYVCVWYTCAYTCLHVYLCVYSFQSARFREWRSAESILCSA